MRIAKIVAREILDSRGNPTIEEIGVAQVLLAKPDAHGKVSLPLTRREFLV